MQNRHTIQPRQLFPPALDLPCDLVHRICTGTDRTIRVHQPHSCIGVAVHQLWKPLLKPLGLTR